MRTFPDFVRAGHHACFQHYAAKPQRNMFKLEIKIPFVYAVPGQAHTLHSS